MSKTLIIGGAGFIGAHLAKLIAKEGDPVDILDNFSRAIRDPFLREIEAKSCARVIDADMLDPKTPSLLDCNYKTIYQFAAIIGVRHVMERPYEVLQKNVVIQANAIELAKRQKALDHFFFTSTSEVYAGSLTHMSLPVPTPENVPLTLTDISHPRTSYMLSKIYGEAMCQQSSLPFTILRPHNIYGPRMGLVHVLPELIKKAIALPKNGNLDVASVEHRRAFCFIDDATEMMRLLGYTIKTVGGTFNIGNQEQEITIGDFADIILRKIGRTDLRVLPLKETPGSPVRRCPDMVQTYAATGYRPVIDLEEGILRTYKWYVENVFSDEGASSI
jgi:nucleoside-diphosphate-sugar epimerase